MKLELPLLWTIIVAGLSLAVSAGTTFYRVGQLEQKTTKIDILADKNQQQDLHIQHVEDSLYRVEQTLQRIENAVRK